MFKYFVSYVYNKGFGNSETVTNYKIQTFKDIKSITEKIEEDGNLKDVLILNFIELKGKNNGRKIKEQMGNMIVCGRHKGKLLEQNIILTKRINKAIEYLESTPSIFEAKEDWNTDLLKILKGENN